MLKKIHKKPTQSFGYINFSKTGKVSKHISQLPDIKEDQEKDIAIRFIDSLNRNIENPLFFIKSLSENDNDVLLSDSNKEIEVEITELTNYDYAIPLVNGKFIDKPKSQRIEYLKRDYPYTTDPQKYISALMVEIKNKINQNYSKNKNRELWLLVFCLSHYEVEYWTSGKKIESESLILARNYLNSTEHGFDKIWFYHPDINPTLIYAKLNKS